MESRNIPSYVSSFIESFNDKGGLNSNILYEQAIYYAMEEVRRTPGVQVLRIGRHDFYFLPSIQLGIFVRVCRFKSVPRGHNRQEHPFDMTNGLLACSTEDAKAACGALLQEHPNATFVCGIGNRSHEQAVFITREGRSKNVRIYNCNWFTASARIVDEFCRSIDCVKSVYHSALHRRSNNAEGICGALSWCEIVIHFRTATAPFNRAVAIYSLRQHERRLN